MKDTIQKVSLIGFGNVGFHLCNELENCGITVTHILTRTTPDLSGSTTNAQLISDASALPEEQLVIICVPDDSIPAILKEIPENCPVAYTSGATELDKLPQREHLGVFYPLQTFSRDITVNMFEVPFFIEATNEQFASQLFDLAWTISRKVSYANSTDRKRLHLAAVWVNNFTNHINHVAHTYLERYDLSYDHLRPLLEETVRKLSTDIPYNCQTGPARRNDVHVMEQHLSDLSGTEKEIYRLISENIQKTYSK